MRAGSRRGPGIKCSTLSSLCPGGREFSQPWGTIAPSPTQGPSLPGPGSDLVLAVSPTLLFLPSSSCPCDFIYSGTFNDQSCPGLQHRGGFSGPEPQSCLTLGIFP